MKSLRNGSLLANVALFIGGVTAGSLATWWLGGRGEALHSTSRLGSTTPEIQLPSTRDTALNKNRVGDSDLKLGQIMAANDPQHKHDDLRRLGQEVASGSINEALKMAEGIASDSDRQQFLNGTFAAWAEQNPQMAADYAMKNLAAGQSRSEAIRIAMEKWGAADPRAAFQWMEKNLTGPLKEEALVALAQGWTRKSPQQAADWFVETGSTSQPLLSSIATNWARVDATAAATWAGNLSPSENRKVGLVSAIGEIARNNPTEAAKLAEPFLEPTTTPGQKSSGTSSSDTAQNTTNSPNSTPSTSEPALPAVPDLATVLADIWGTNDPASAAQWIDKLTDGPAKLEAAGTLASVWAARDIESAVRWGDSITDPALKAGIVQHLGTTWGATDPTKALAWLDTQPAEYRGNGLKGALNSWAAVDAPGMQTWIEAQPAGPRNDLARRTLGDVISSEQPMGSLELAFGMSDPIQQSDALVRYFNNLRRREPEAATEWLNSEWSRIPAPAQQAISKSVKR